MGQAGAWGGGDLLPHFPAGARTCGARFWLRCFLLAKQVHVACRARCAGGGGAAGEWITHSDAGSLVSLSAGGAFIR